MMTYKTEMTERFTSESDAVECLDALRLQVDFEGGRVLDHTRTDGCYLVQAIFPDYGNLGMTGCNRRLCPDSFLKTLAAN